MHTPLGAARSECVAPWLWLTDCPLAVSRQKVCGVCKSLAVDHGEHRQSGFRLIKVNVIAFKRGIDGFFHTGWSLAIGEIILLYFASLHYNQLST